jgi:ferredoxin
MADLPVLSHGGAARADREALIDFHASGEGGEPTWDHVRPALAAPAAWREAIEALEREAARHGAALVAGARAPVECYMAEVRRAHEAVEGRFREELRRLVASLTPAPAGGTERSALAGELGASGPALLDPERLARLLPHLRGVKTLPPERLAALAEARATLEGWLGRSDGPAITVLHAGAWPRGLALSGVEVVHSDDPLAAACAAFDERARATVELLRAARRLRLEIDGAFRPGRHERALARYDWRSVAPAERPLLPRLLVLEEADRVRSAGLGPLSNLLRSGRPVDVLLIDRPLERLAVHDDLDLAAALAAQRIAAVLQSTLARPEHLAAGLARLVRSPLPTLAVVAVPSAEAGSAPALELLAAHVARVTPCFEFDPLAGDTWRACLRLDADPAPDGPWPLREVRHVDAQGVAQTRSEAFTPAHAVALAAGGSRHFRTVRPEAASDDQLEVAAYLALPEGERRGKLPFIWLADADGRPLRAVATRAVTAACRERLARWYRLAELAGAGAAPVAPAAEPGASVAVVAAMPPVPDSMLADPLRQREASILQLLNALLDLEGEAAIALPSPTPTAASPAPAQGAAPVPPAAGPTIDTALCTSCNECINLNPRMFKYDGNKQATIADASAGTFAELVKAAEKCPARCIHPGVPRNGDRTATDKLVARAARFN